MLSKFLALSAFLLFTFSQAQRAEMAAIRKFQQELNAEYKNPNESPLRGSNFTAFKKHPFFPVNLNYRVKALFTRSKDAVAFELPTSSGKTQPYIEFGKVTFTLNRKTYTLSVYQSLNLTTKEGFADYLFLPFRDATNGKETYGGGKYLDLRIPRGAEIIIDFNKSYQPYCAYNAFDYNCPVVPEANFLPVRIEAGVMYEDNYHH